MRVIVQRQTALLTGIVRSRSLIILAEILAEQIEGISQIKDETEKGTVSTSKTARVRELDFMRETIQLLFATDQTLRAGVLVGVAEGGLSLEGQVGTAAQKSWAEQLTASVAGEINSKLKIGAPPAPALAESKPLDLDDESLQALILLRLRLVRETEHLPMRVKANRGVVSLQGKVRTEALRQRVENLTRSTLGLRELRSTISITA